MGKHRTPNDLLAEALEKVNALKVKVAETALKNHPRMKSLLMRESEIKRELSKAARWLDPEKGLEARIAKLTDMIGEAKNKLENAEEIKDSLNAELDSIQDEKSEVASDISPADIQEHGKG
tara:strand:- start:155 stop:517 length:363 start_codon:yes stop_codon:yes gene_type:complete